MTIKLDEQLARLVQRQVDAGRFPDADSVVKAALQSLDDAAFEQGQPSGEYSPARSRAALRSLFEDVDGDPPPRTEPLPDEAFDRGSLYDDRV